MSKRSQGICAVILAVMAGCAIFGTTTALGDHGGALRGTHSGTGGAWRGAARARAAALTHVQQPREAAGLTGAHRPGLTRVQPLAGRASASHGNPHAPGTTGNPHAPGTTGNPHAPGTTGNPHTAGTPHTNGNPHTDGGHGNPHAPGTTGNPHTNGSHGNPHAGGAAGSPASSGSSSGGNISRVGTGGNSRGSGIAGGNPASGGNTAGSGLGGSSTGTGITVTPTGGGPTTSTNTGSGPTARAARTFLSHASLLRHVTPTIGPTGGITIGALATPTGSAGTTAGAGAFALPLAPGLATATALSPGRLPAGTTPTATQVAADAGASQRPHPQSSSPVSVIERVVSVIPGFVWIALAVSLAFAAIAGGAAIWSGRQIRRQANAVAAISAAALTDSLTGVLNRRGFIDAVERELARAKRYGRQFVLAYVDVRGLKAVNDTEGHLAGDRLLRHAAQLLTESARADDVVGRIGGDEMGILLVEQGVEGASAVASRIASRVPECRVELGLHSPWDLTIGTATYPADGESVNELLATADRRLYEQRGIALS